MRYLIIFLLLWSAIGDFFVSKVAILGILDELIVLALMVHLLLHAIAKAGKYKLGLRFTITGLLISILLLWACFSFIINGSPITQLLKFVLSISKGFIIFYWTKKFLRSPIIVNEILKLIKWLILIQIPFFIFGLILFRGDYFGDNAVGAIITGDASAVATFFWLGIMICAALYEQRNDKRYLIYSLFLTSLLIVTSTKQLTVLLPIVLLYLYGRRIKAAKLKQVTFVVIGLVVGIMLYNAVERKWMLNYGVDTSEVNMLDYLDESEKLLGYYSVVYELPTQIKYPIMWGAGPGMYGSYVAMNARAPLAQKYIMYYFDRIPEGLGGTLAYRSSSVIGFWGDIGFAGLIFIFSIYIYQTFYHANRMKALSQNILYNLLIASGLLLLAQSFFLNVFEGNTFTLNLFWILCGISAAGIYTSKENLSGEVCV